MDRHAESACDVADDLITGQRIAAARKLDQTIIESFNVDSGAYMTLALGAAPLCDGLRRIVGLLILLDVYLPDAGHDLPQLYTAVADGCVEVIYRVAVMALDNGLQAFFEVIFGELHARLHELMLKHRLAFDDVLLTLLFLEPLTDLGTRGVGLDYLKPVALGA